MDGYSDSPDRATSERGRAYLTAAVRAVGDAFTEFYDATRGVTVLMIPRIEAIPIARSGVGAVPIRSLRSCSCGYIRMRG